MQIDEVLVFIHAHKQMQRHGLVRHAGREFANGLAQLRGGDILAALGKRGVQNCAEGCILLKLISKRDDQLAQRFLGDRNTDFRCGGGETAFGGNVCVYFHGQRCKMGEDCVAVGGDNLSCSIEKGGGMGGELGKHAAPVCVAQAQNLCDFRLACTCKGQKRFPFGGEAFIGNCSAHDGDAVAREFHQKIQACLFIAGSISGSQQGAHAFLRFAKTDGEDGVLQCFAERTQNGCIFAEDGRGVFIGLQTVIHVRQDHVALGVCLGK